MNELTDQQLLRDYAARRSEAAFTELVRRHIDLVHSAAARMTGEAHSAQDVTQAVFVALTQNATRLTNHPVLSGWLHTTARNLAAKHVRAAVRRQHHEQEAAAMNELLATAPDASWDEIAPHLDAAMGELAEPERNVVLLCYFERLTAEEIGSRLAISEAAAQKRVSRAVERLRELFAKRGVTVGAGGLVLVISANAVKAAPVGLAVTISAAALAGTTVTTSTLIAATTTTIAMTTLQKTIVAATVAVLASAGIYEARQAAHLREQNQTLQQQQEPLATQMRLMQGERDQATNRLADSLAENARLKSNPHQYELLKLRGVYSSLKYQLSQTNDATQLAAKSWMNRVSQLKERLEQTPSAGIPELQLLTDADWLAAAQERHFDSENEYRIAFQKLRQAAQGKFGKEIHAALRKYLEANEGKFPTDIGQLRDYFGKPVDEAMLGGWQVAPAQDDEARRVGDWVITQKSAVDDVLDWRVYFGRGGEHWTPFFGYDGPQSLEPVYEAYRKANNGGWNKDLPKSNLLPFATTPEQQAAVWKLIERDALRQLIDHDSGKTP